MQLLLGFLELSDVAHHHDQCGRGVEIKGFGGNQPGKHLTIVTAKGHFQVSNASGLQPLQQPRSDAGNAPDVEVGGGLTDDFYGFQSDLLFEGFVYFQQATVGQPRDHQNVRALLEYRCEFLLGQA